MVGGGSLGCFLFFELAPILLGGPPGGTIRKLDPAHLCQDLGGIFITNLTAQPGGELADLLTPVFLVDLELPIQGEKGSLYTESSSNAPVLSSVRPLGW